ncbi:MAG: sulfur carrier protein ThiS [Thermodesulfobacteriota bacterium]
MIIICNGEEQEVAEGCTLSQLLDLLQLAPDTVVVECDKKIVNRIDYETTVLAEGQNLELIRFVGGG